MSSIIERHAYYVTEVYALGTRYGPLLGDGYYYLCPDCGGYGRHCYEDPCSYCSGRGEIDMDDPRIVTYDPRKLINRVKMLLPWLKNP